MTRLTAAIDKKVSKERNGERAKCVVAPEPVAGAAEDWIPLEALVGSSKPLSMPADKGELEDEEAE